ncbi:MAG: sigma-54 dependent transcriptional regulator [Candidatus Nitrospinota bacterium M3_3B_026]
MSCPVLIVDLDRLASETLRALLESAGAKARAAYDPAELPSLDIESGYSVIVADPRFPGVKGKDVIGYLRSRAPNAAIVSAAGPGEGGSRALSKPYGPESVSAIMELAGEARKRAGRDFVNMIGRSEPMLALYDTIRAVAGTDSSALIHGETGAGKELVAAAIHSLSRRKGKKFVTINCGALSEPLLEAELFGHERGAFTGAVRAKAGKFENADGGTVFLDEIGETSPATQLKLLKVIETGEVERLGANRVIKTDARMIFATNRDLSSDVQAGRFRKDLFYRINVFPIRVPPLRERREDIPALAAHFLSIYASRHGRDVRAISPEGLRDLVARDWKGNVRELEHVIERAVIVARGDILTAEDLGGAGRGREEDGPLESLSGLTHKEMTRTVMSVYERRYLVELLEDCGGNVALAARRAGVDRKTLYNKMRRHGVDPAELRGSSDA